MVLKRLGRKQVDILVNGSQAASFSQDTESADYNVNISTNGESMSGSSSDTVSTYYNNPGSRTLLNIPGLSGVHVSWNVNLQENASLKHFKVNGTDYSDDNLSGSGTFDSPTVSISWRGSNYTDNHNLSWNIDWSYNASASYDVEGVNQS